MSKIITVFFLLIGCEAYAQNTIKGVVSDENQQLLANVNLIIYPKASNTILAYTTTNGKGNFLLSFTANVDSVRLEFSSLGYEKKMLFLANKTIPSLQVSLKGVVNTLREVVIKDEIPIKQRGDTINYNVKSFADKNDRVIIDVIKNLPGIKVTESGQILYQNKAINKFYVDGKDLLENRYNLATNNLPVDAVSQVQLLENHQPINMLVGVEESDRAAINIKLNPDAKLKLLGNGNVGLGFAPFLRDNNVAVLKFAKNIQYINTIKNNNVGVNLDRELNEQNLSLNTILSGNIKQDLLTIVRASAPPLNAERFMFNNNTLASSNYLVGISKSFNLKANVAYGSDNLINNSSSITQIFLPNDTIVIDENQSGRSNYHKLISGAILEANTQKLYFKNALKFQRIWSDENNFISSNQVQQYLKNPFISLTNELSGVIRLKNNFLAVNSYTSFTNLPHELNIFPGQFINLLNSGLPYEGLTQNVQSKIFFSNQMVSFGRKSGAIYFNNKTGLLLSLTDLNNELDLDRNGSTTPAIGNFANEIERNQLKVYDEASISYMTKKLNLMATANVDANILSNRGFGTYEKASAFFFNPNFKFRYNLSSFFITSLNFNADNDISYTANPSFILQNYRSLINSDVPLYKIESKSVVYSLNYKNIVTAIFANFSINYSRSSTNVLLQTRFDQQLITQTAIVQNNPANDLTIGGNINKYYLGLKTGIDLSVNYGVSNTKQIQQGLLTDFQNTSIKVGSKINTQFSKAFSLNHRLEITRYKNSSVQSERKISYAPLYFLKQDLNLSLFLPKAYSTKLSFEHYYNNATLLRSVNYFFADFKLMKTLTKPKLDFSVTLSNIFNTKSFTGYSYSTNYLINSNYALRGRMAIFKVGFQF